MPWWSWPIFQNFSKNEGAHHQTCPRLSTLNRYSEVTKYERAENFFIHFVAPSKHGQTRFFYLYYSPMPEDVLSSGSEPRTYGACCSCCCLWFCSCKRAVASNNLLYSFNHLLFITNKPNLVRWCWKASNNNNTVIIANIYILMTCGDTLN